MHYRRKRQVVTLLLAAAATGTFFLHFRAVVNINVNIKRPRPVGDLGRKETVTAPSPSVVDLALDGSWKPSKFKDFNDHYINVLETCRSGGACAPNANKLVILAWGHFKRLFDGTMQGESVWCDSVMDAIHALGYSMIISSSIPELHELYRHYQDNVQIILWSNDDFHDEGRFCLDNSTCAQLNPDTYVAPNATHTLLPAWKIFALHWWNNANHPLGPHFTLSPENYATFPRAPARENYYLGYSLEKTCMKTPYIPPSDRPRQAYVFSKRLSFFLEKSNYILPEKNVEDQVRSDFFSSLATELNITFLGNFAHDVPGPIPEGIVKIPRLNRAAFQNVTAQSRVVLGIGRPFLSPTPWEVLCLGVPFINPVQHWSREKPDDRSLWSGQQDAIIHSDLGEPYVYHVKVGDRAGYERAIKKAMDTPIPRYIPPQMKVSALIERVKVLLETDWAPTARQHLAKLSEASKAP